MFSGKKNGLVSSPIAIIALKISKTFEDSKYEDNDTLQPVSELCYSKVIITPLTYDCDFDHKPEYNTRHYWIM